MTGAMIIPFVGIERRAAQENLEALIAQSKGHGWFLPGPHAVDWSANSWDLRPFVHGRGQLPGLVVHFTTVETTRRGPRAANAIDFAQPFLEAAKALVVEFSRTASMVSPGKFVAALRYVEKAFRDLDLAPDICELTPAVLDRAAEMIGAELADSWTHGRMLERLVHEYVNRGRLSRLHLLWRTPFKYKGARRNDRVNKTGGAGETSDKLPHLKCILDLAGVFHTSGFVPDLVVTSWFALAMFAPSRVTEILTLPLRCATEMDDVFGISWRPLKGGMPLTKFAATDEWANVAKKAIRRLDEIGAKCRAAAKWYEDNPGQLYLPPGWEHMRGQPLTKWEVARIVGKSKGLVPYSGLDRALEANGQFTRDPNRLGGRSGRSRLYTFESVERYVTSILPEGFPYADRKHGLKVSEALFCLPLDVLRGYADTLEYVPSMITYSQIKHELGSKPTGQTLAARHNLLDPDTGKPWKLNTHQPRHLLNTLAQSKHLSQALIAFWSGRKKVSQNAWYDHLPQEVFIEAFLRMGDQAPVPIKVVGPLDDKVAERSRKEAVSYEDALRLELGSTINTRFGLCRHNYTLTPCPKDKNCIGCGENTFIKGDARHLTEARSQLEISRRAVAQCRQAIAEDEPGVEKWLEKHLEREARWAMALEKLTDPAIPDGTLITLPPPDHSQSKAGLSAEIRAAELAVPKSTEDDLAIMEDL